MRDSPLAIVSARDAAETVGTVVSAIVRSGLVGAVIVVDRGSTDDTIRVAAMHGATVIACGDGSKGACLRSVLARVADPVILTFDADIIGLRPEHVAALTVPVIMNDMTAAVGLPDYGLSTWQIQNVIPLTSGVRAIKSDVFGRVSEQGWGSPHVDVFINQAAESAGPVERVLLHGMELATKTEDSILSEGGAGIARMARSLLVALGSAYRGPK